MSYASVMEFLRTGMSSGPGTEDPRYAGFAGQRLYDNYASTAEPWGAPLAGQRLYDDYASTAQPWGAPIAGGLPGPPAYQCADACFNFCEKWLPGAEQIVLEDCGHVPQVERSEQTIGLLRRFFARVDALAAPRARAA